MNDLDQPTADCGCCAGIDSETPRRIDNAPGLPTIAYRVGTYARFKESMLSRLSSSAYTALAELRTRDDSDFSIALCDAFAMALDVLTFYQERTANEHYLCTATERRSVLEMARLIGYELAPGVAASTYLAFTLQETPGDPSQGAAPITIPVRVPVQSVPGQDEQPQTFETVERFEARVEWNAIPVQTSETWRPVRGDTDLWLERVNTQLQAGDAILIVGSERASPPPMGDPGSERWDVRVLDTVEIDTARNRTRVAWADGLGSASPLTEPAAQDVRVFVFRQRAALFGHNAPDPNLMSTTGSNLGPLIEDVPNGQGLKKWANYQLSTDPARIDLDAAYPQIITGSWLALVSNEGGFGSATLPGYVELCRALKVYQVSRSAFGLSGRITRVQPDTEENLTPQRFKLRDTLVLAQSEELTPASRSLSWPLYGDHAALENRVDGLRLGQAMAVSGTRQRISIRPGATNLTLVLDNDERRCLDEADSLFLLAPPLGRRGSTDIYLSPEDFSASLEAGSPGMLQLRVKDRDGRSGRLTARGSDIILDTSHEDDPVVSEIAFIATNSDAITHGRDRTRLRFSAPLKHCYERATVRLNGNVGRATHGETVEEILGGSDAGLPDQSFVLRQSPLTYVSADAPSGRAATLSLRVNDLLWTEVPTLYGRPTDARIYTLRIDDEAKTTVCFGDGVEGARPPTGQHNIRATYRKGLGVGGNIAAGRLSTLLRRPLGVSGVANPESATGGEDPESPDQARDNAPLTVRTLERAVSIRDYADFACAFAGISKAHALWVPAGPGRGVFLTIAGIEGTAVLEGSDTCRNLLTALKTYGDPVVPVRLVNYRPAQFRLGLLVRVAANHDTERVLEAVRDALRQAFGFSKRNFGQGVSLDEVVGVAHTVRGVEAAHVRTLYRPDSPVSSSPQQRLQAATPVASLTEVPQPAELLTLVDPLRVEVLQ